MRPTGYYRVAVGGKSCHLKPRALCNGGRLWQLRVSLHGLQGLQDGS
jgi:hypothetical protein